MVPLFRCAKREIKIWKENGIFRDGRGALPNGAVGFAGKYEHFALRTVRRGLGPRARQRRDNAPPLPGQRER